MVLTPKRILVLLTLFTFLFSIYLACLDHYGIVEPAWAKVVTTLIFSIIIFWWYLRDSHIRSYKRSLLLNLAVLGFSPIGLPYYIFRSRTKEERLGAFVKFLGFVALLFLVSVIGGILMLWVFSGGSY